jgi:hypothetical protein
MSVVIDTGVYKPVEVESTMQWWRREPQVVVGETNLVSLVYRPVKMERIDKIGKTLILLNETHIHQEVLSGRECAQLSVCVRVRLRVRMHSLPAWPVRS